MPELNRRSLDALSNVDDRLMKIAREAITRIGFAVTQGYRDPVEQDRLYAEGKSKLKGGKSKHNRSPAHAFDFIPQPFSNADWSNIQKFREVARVLCAVAAEQGVEVRWGGTWTSNVDDPLARFLDGPHFELA